MRDTPRMAIAIGIWMLPFDPVSGAASPVETCFEKMPPGWSVTKSFIVADDQTRAIGQRLGAPMRRLSNTFLLVHGQPIQMNVLHAGSDADAATLHAAIVGMKSDPSFCARDGWRVIECTGRAATVALATKVAFELGFRPRPRAIRYRVTAELATLEKSDYMHFNELCGLFLGADSSPSDSACPTSKSSPRSWRGRAA